MQAQAQLPSITLGTLDHDRLRRIAEGAQRIVPDVAEYLMRELDRATILKTEAISRERVRMGCLVKYRDEETGQERLVQLVYPVEADPVVGRISVLTPVGAALIGLSEGQSIELPSRRGGSKTLTILRVRSGQDRGGHKLM
jgi:regulator of nucleoside diphosphate kinase